MPTSGRSSACPRLDREPAGGLSLLWRTYGAIQPLQDGRALGVPARAQEVMARAHHPGPLPLRRPPRPRAGVGRRAVHLHDLLMRDASPRALRKFALTVGGVFLLLGTLSWWRGHLIAPRVM